MSKGLSNIITISTNQNETTKKPIVLPGSTQSLITDSNTQVYNQSTRDYYKGKSFRFLGKWLTGKHYFCDEFFQDWVSLNGVLLICTKSHLSDYPPEIIYEHGIPIRVESEEWELVTFNGAKRYSFVYVQEVPSKVWEIEHNLDVYPSVTIMNEDNEEIVGDVIFNDLNNITITFSEPLVGKVSLV